MLQPLQNATATSLIRNATNLNRLKKLEYKSSYTYIMECLLDTNVYTGPS